MIARRQIRRSLHCIALAVAALTGVGPVHAQSVVLDPALGNGASLGNGPTYSITETMGRTIGTNLFHSFDRFSLLGGETAEFSTAGAIENILARVTGGTVSTIDGTIRAPANLFFLNPSGIVFNSGATLDVNGAFHASTADYLRMGSMAFYVDESQASGSLPSVFSIDPGVLLDAADTFGFLTESPGAITINEGSLGSSDGGRIALVGGDTTMTGGELFAEGGRIDVASVGSPGEAVLTDTGVSTSSFARMGTLRLGGDAALDVSESFVRRDGAGRVIIRAGRLEMDAATLSAGAIFAGGGVIDIDVSSGLFLTNGSWIRSWSDGEGEASPIRIVAGEIEIRGGSEIGSRAGGSGRGGDVTIDASQSILISDPEGSSPFGTGVESTVFFGEGSAGDIAITAPSLTMERGHISANVQSTILRDVETSGRAGNIRIQTDLLSMSDDATIQNNTNNSAPPTPGSGTDTEIRIRPLDPLADSVIHLAGGSSIRSRARDSSQDTSNILLEATEVRLKEGSNVSATVSSGPASAGDVEIVVDHLSLEGGAFIESEALWSSTGNAGDIKVLARESVSLDNDDGGVRTQISSTNRGTGASGQISWV